MNLGNEIGVLGVILVSLGNICPYKATLMPNMLLIDQINPKNAKKKKKNMISSFYEKNNYWNQVLMGLKWPLKPKTESKSNQNTVSVLVI